MAAHPEGGQLAPPDDRRGELDEPGRRHRGHRRTVPPPTGRGPANPRDGRTRASRRGDRQVGPTGGPPRYGAGMTAVDHPGPASHADAWIASGAAALAGWDGGPGLVPPPGVLARIARLGACGGADPWATMTERAAVAGLRRRGRTSCGGGTRLVRAADGWLAVSLVRPDDVAAVPAWLEVDLDPTPDPWPAVVREVGRRPTAPLVAQAVLLGMPVAAVGERTAPGATGEGGGPRPGARVRRRPAPRRARRRR